MGGSGGWSLGDGQGEEDEEVEEMGPEEEAALAAFMAPGAANFQCVFPVLCVHLHCARVLCLTCAISPEEAALAAFMAPGAANFQCLFLFACCCCVFGQSQRVCA